jgi:hypothetical protein
MARVSSKAQSPQRTFNYCLRVQFQKCWGLQFSFLVVTTENTTHKLLSYPALTLYLITRVVARYPSLHEDFSPVQNTWSSRLVSIGTDQIYGVFFSQALPAIWDAWKRTGRCEGH